MRCGASAEHAQGVAICRKYPGETHSWQSSTGSCSELFPAGLFLGSFHCPLLFPLASRLLHKQAATHSSPLLVLPDHFWSSLSSLLELDWEPQNGTTVPKTSSILGKKHCHSLRSLQGTCCLSCCSRSCSFSTDGFFSLSWGPSGTVKKSSPPVFLRC